MPVPNTARPPSIRLLTIAVPIVMAMVAINQQRLVHTGVLTPWKGGGFGMFSNPESPPINRVLSASGITRSGQTVRIALPYGRKWTRLRNNPTDERMAEAIHEISTIKLMRIRRPWLDRRGPLLPAVSPVPLRRRDLFERVGLYTLSRPLQRGEGPLYRELTLNLWNLHAHLARTSTTVSYELIFSKTVAFDTGDDDDLANPND